jgi:hypothetical protein
MSLSVKLNIVLSLATLLIVLVFGGCGVPAELGAGFFTYLCQRIVQVLPVTTANMPVRISHCSLTRHRGIF